MTPKCGTRLIFVRHAEAEGNIQRVFHGWTNSSITEKGHLQAQRVAEHLKNIPVDVLYSSSLKRTLQTAEYIAKAKELPIIRTDQLREINGGDWENVPFIDLAVRWPKENAMWENEPHMHVMPNGESMEGFQNRLIDEVSRIVKDNKGKTILIVTHGTAIRVLLCHFLALSFNELKNVHWCENTAVTMVDVPEGGESLRDTAFRVIVEGDFSHLDSETSTIINQEWWIKFKQERKKDDDK